MPSRTTQYRQGDVLLSLVPPTCTTVYSGGALGAVYNRFSGMTHLNRIDRRPLAYGEKTGHSHTIEETKPIELYEDRFGTLYCRVIEPNTQMLHQEHGPINIKEPGLYEVTIQQEYDPLRGYQPVSD